MLDVVYNHVGASRRAARCAAFGPYFTEQVLDVLGRGHQLRRRAAADPVREWVLQSAEGWVRDFHVDGLRLDAIHAIYDSRRGTIVAELADRVHAAAAHALVIAESGLNDPKVMRPPAQGGWAATPPGPTTSTTRCARC